MAENVSVLRLTVRYILAFILIGIALFLPAGTLLWIEAWIYLVIFFGFFIVLAIYLKKRDPELMEKRLEMKVKEKWDKIFILLSSLTIIPLYFIPGFDAVRFQWTIMPIVLKVIGFIGFALSLILILLVMRENTYLSRAVEIQKERGHKVITTGPYRVIRHPMYAGVITMTICHCFALGSYYSLIAAGLFAITLIYRTIREDKVLFEQLEGFDQYAQETKKKLIPYIW